MRVGSEPAGRPADDGDRVHWRCLLVNNMPDSAFEATERQYLRLLEAAAGCRTVELACTTVDGVPRGERAAERIAVDYSPFAEISGLSPDLLIVTGSNPVADRLEDEPYWGDLVDLLAWARAGVPTVLLSCLSAHAALAALDGIHRVRLEEKCTGVFPQSVDPGHPLAAGLGAPFVLPHSRLNAVPTATLEDAGWRVAVDAGPVGWSVATRQVDRAAVVLVQGHPEYDPSSLLREYHRDVRRYVLHERDDLPRLPVDCVAPADRDGLARLHTRVVGGERDPALVDAYPFDDVGERAPWSWRDAATQLYANWLAGVPERSE
jgi:homoserine O-succinyltransferase